MGRLKIISNLNHLLNKFGYHFSRIDEMPSSDRNKVLLNLGSGNWSHDRWYNLDYPSEWYAKAQKKHKIIPYDIRNDDIPFENDSVDAIYCSHVIEHIENVHIFKMLRECFRVLKKGAVLRIACPDAEFLYKISKIDADTDYWKWRKDWFNSSFYYKQGVSPRKVDYLVREIATPKLLNYANSVNTEDYSDAFQNMEMYPFFEYLTGNLSFRSKFPGDHINYWTFDKLDEHLKNAGFRYVIRSKRGASCCEDMKSPVKFDLTCPVMSLYVDVIK